MKKHLALFTAAFTLAPGIALACACGCGVFDVGTASVFPTKPGGTVFFEYDYVNQKRNWNGTTSSPETENEDKNIRSSFMTIGARYMFDRSWGVMASVPYWDRNVKSDGGSGVESFSHDGIGDIRLKGVYSGFSADMSSGVTFGVKLATGDHNDANFSRDTQIGSGSTDLLLGAYHMGALMPGKPWNWFANAEWDQPVVTQDDYRPGSEVNAGIGLYYNGWTIGSTRIAPVAQVIGTTRLSDRGAAAETDNTGYERVLLSPGIEVDTGEVRIYTDVAFPVYQHVNGNQLIAPVLFKLNVSRHF